MKLHTLDTAGLVLVVIEMVWRVIVSNMETTPAWTHAITWILLGLILVFIIAHFVLRHKEKKQDQ